MIRFLVNIVMSLLAAAVGLLVAAAILPDFNISATGFVTVVVIFGILQGVLGPFVFSVARRNVPALLGGIGLVTTLVSLVITDLVSDGLTISGATTWILATLIVWLASLIASLIIPFVLVKLGVESARKRRDV